ALTGDQIRSVVREEVAKVATGGKKPEDMVDDIVNAVTMGDKLREKLGLPGLGSRLLSNQGLKVLKYEQSANRRDSREVAGEGKGRGTSA
ncbi:unnamed protein product, partial [marine sediment metagenome]